MTPCVIHGPALPVTPLVLDSPHSGTQFPPDFDAIVSQHALRDGEDCFIDALYSPAAAVGVPLLAASFPRTYLDPNRHAGNVDLELVDGGAWQRQQLRPALTRFVQRHLAARGSR